MKTRLSVLVVVASFLPMILIAGCTQPNKEAYYGTWINEKGHYQKMVHISDGIVQNFTLLSDTAPTERAQVQIVKCWSDSDGNVWFNVQGTILEGPHKNTVPKIQTLERINKRGDFLEVMVKGVVDFNPKGFPTKIDPTDPYLYMSFSRAAK